MQKVLLVAALTLLPVAGHAAALTLPLQGHVAEIGGPTTARLSGNVTFHPTALLGAPFVEVDALTLIIAVRDGHDGAADTVYTLLETSPALLARPAVWSTAGGGYALELEGIASFAGEVLAFAAAPLDDGFAVFEANSFALVGEGTVSVVPLPAAVWMLGAGLAGLGLLRQGQRQRRA